MHLGAHSLKIFLRVLQDTEGIYLDACEGKLVRDYCSIFKQSREACNEFPMSFQLLKPGRTMTLIVRKGNLTTVH
jgi:hypothetical protein